MASRSILQNFPTSSASETRHYLTTHTITDDELMRELWNMSGLPGLLDARRMGTSPRPLRRGERDFIYNPASGKYRRVLSNRTVSEAEIRRAVFKVSTEAKNRIRTQTKQMMAGAILFVIWYARVRSILKALFRAVWTVTLGGLLFENEATRNAFYLWSILYFDKLDMFKIAIETGTMPFNGHIVSAAGRMARAANGMFQNAKLAAGRRVGHNEAMRVLGENENHCHDSDDRPGCIELAELGWIPIDQIVPITQATCRENCLCQIRTRKRPNA